ncbi:radical SAM protein [Clostridium diolis]|uniref:radical SAM protein n=1 Tax=Clostridium diolis TaxID=223919 RepID=UPI003AF8B61F
MTDKLNEVSFEILQKCPNNCLHCSSNSHISCKHITKYIIFKQVIDDAIKLGMERLCLSGGEPFLHPDLIKMVSYAKKYNIEVYIYTSGIVKNNNGLDESISSNILLELKKLNVDKLIYNVQAVTDESYDFIMQTKGNLNLLKESIQKSVSLDIYSEIHFVPMKININDIHKVINFAKDLKVKQISFLRFVPQGRGLLNKELLYLTLDDFVMYMKNINLSTEVLGDLKIRLGIPLSHSVKTSSCNAGWGKLIIRYDGAVFPCEAYKYINCLSGKKVEPDNINNKKLKEIWDNSEFLNILRADIAAFKDINVGCETCPAQSNYEKYINNCN